MSSTDGTEPPSAEVGVAGMLSLPELARAHTDLNDAEIDHCQRLTAAWGLLADLSFADLLLFAPVSGSDQVVVLGQIRPTTSQTRYHSDYMGRVLRAEERPLVKRAFAADEIIDGSVTLSEPQEEVRVQCIPVRHRGVLVAVMTRELPLSFGRQPGELERTYVEVFTRLARMITAGRFPFPGDDSESEVPPRVGDGVIVLDETALVTYASPNGVSALHRMGIHANAEGRRLAELGLDDEGLNAAFALALPVTEEVERGPGITFVVRAIPLIDGTTVDGAVVLLRDVSELRSRDRLLLSKDATIREIHHRVKNNLQTISSLLRLQGRRLDSREAEIAVEDSVNRIQSIAVIHDILSREAGEDVPFIEILRSLIRTVEEGLLPQASELNFELRGDPGVLPATVATPLAIVLYELLQNVVEHGYETDHRGGRVVIEVHNDGQTLKMRVADDGVGLPPGFEVETSTGLGLSIVRTLFDTELSGELSMGAPESGPGTVVDLEVPVHG